jgi:hypothetical protein
MSGTELSLFALFMEYRGGTHISQVKAKDHICAPRIWVEELDTGAISGVKKNFRKKLRKSLEDFELIVPIEGIVNTWCCSFVHVEGITVHLTKTSQ